MLRANLPIAGELAYNLGNLRLATLFRQDVATGRACSSGSMKTGCGLGKHARPTRWLCRGTLPLFERSTEVWASCLLVSNALGTHNYDWQLTLDGGRATVRMFRGKQVAFSVSQNIVTPGVPYVLGDRIMTRASPYRRCRGPTSYYSVTPNRGTSTVKDPFDSTCGSDGNCDGGKSDGVVTEIRYDTQGGYEIIRSSFLGGGGHEEFHNGASDVHGNYCVIGASGSTDYPTTNGAYKEKCDGCASGRLDAVLSCFNVQGRIYYSSHFGHDDFFDTGWGVDFTRDGKLVWTGSTAGGFPVTTGAMPGGSIDGVAACVDPELAGAASLVWATQFGREGVTAVNDSALDRWGQLHIVVEGPGTHLDGCSNSGLHLVLSPDGTEIVDWSCLGGGKGGERPTDIVIDPSGNPIVAALGFDDYPVTADAVDSSFNGGLNDMVLIRDTARRRDDPRAGFNGGLNDMVLIQIRANPPTLMLPTNLTNSGANGNSGEAGEPCSNVCPESSSTRLRNLVLDGPIPVGFAR